MADRPVPPPPVRRVRAVVLSWNGGPLVEEAVAALLATDWDGHLEVVVVDNASTDGSREALRRRFGRRIRLIANDRNAGFGANNLAMADRTDVDAIALINPDALVEPGWLAPLVAALDDDAGLGAACPLLVLAPRFATVEVRSQPWLPGAGDGRSLGVRLEGVEVAGVDRFADVVVGGGVHDLEVGRAGPFRWTDGAGTLHVPLPDGAEGPVTIGVRCSSERPGPVTVVDGDGIERGGGEVAPGRATVVTASVDPASAVDLAQNAGSFVFADGAGADRCFGRPVGPATAQPADVFAWCGGAVLLRRAHLDDVGLLHEPYFLYYEDTDLSWRGQARGWRFRYVPDAVVRHHHAVSSGTASASFWHFNERNRLLLLVRNAPGPLVRRELRRAVTAVGTTAWRDTVGPLRRGRPPTPTMVVRQLRALAGLARLVPGEVGERRRLRRRQTVPDAALLARLRPR